MRKLGLLATLFSTSIIMVGLLVSSVFAVSGDTNTTDITLVPFNNVLVPNRLLDTNSFVSQHPCVDAISTPVYNSLSTIISYDYYYPYASPPSRTLGTIMYPGVSYTINCDPTRLPVIGDKSTTDIILHSGWNTIILNRSINVDAFVEQHVCVDSIEHSVFSSPGVVSKYEYYTPYVTSPDPAVPVVNRTLGTVMFSGNTYYVHCDASRLPVNLDLTLVHGWNLVQGDNTPLSIMRTVHPKIVTIYSWVGLTQSWLFWSNTAPDFSINLTSFSSGTVYWVFVN